MYCVNTNKTNKDMKKLFMVWCLLGIATTSFAEDLKLTVPELEPKLTYGETTASAIPEPSYEVMRADAVAASNGWKPDFDFFKTKTNPGVKPYKFMDDMTFVGVPLFLGGLAIKGDKAMFRVNNKDGKANTQLLTDFKTGIDDYTQYFGPAMVVGLKLGGYEGRSDWPRLLASAAMSYGLMAALVNGIKYTAKEMRPDGSQANSWPSGHTATSFVGATLLHKEYGLTRSPWFSVAGYGVATATGVMRVLNNRHWVSDVMSGAGIGILSTELGYALCDLMFKGKGLLRNDLEVDLDNPSFFSISMGLGLGGKDLDINTLDDLQDYFAIGQCTPGLIALNVSTFIGNKRKGVLGGIAATLGFVTCPIIIILLIAMFLTNFADLPVVKNAFAGIRVCVCVLILQAVLRLWKKAIVDVPTLCLYLVIFALAAFSSLLPVSVPTFSLVIAAGVFGVFFGKASAPANKKSAGTPARNEKEGSRK